MSAFRTQGILTEDKTRILKDLRVIFHINEDRHKAEARRVTNDERLNTIADVIAGHETSREWTKEGRRTIPLIPRGVAETALIKVADTLSQRYTEMNGTLPHPVDTAVTRPETVVVPLACPPPPPPVPLFDEKSVIFDEKVAKMLEERIPTPDTPEDINSGWSRKRRSSTENINLQQQLYPHVSKAQQMSGKKGTAKKPRKEKAQKQNVANNQQQPQTASKIDYEESISRIQEQNNRDQGFNMRIIHSYASSSIPTTSINTQSNENVSQQQKRHSQSSDYSSPIENSQMIPITYISKNQMEAHDQSSIANVSFQPSNIQVISMAPIETTPTCTNTMSPTIKESHVRQTATEKPPKIQILSNNPVKIVPSISLKTLQAKGNVKVVQSPPGKVVLRPFSAAETESLPGKVTQIKGIPPSVAGAKLNVQKVQLLPVQNSKPNANFLIVRNSSANNSQTVSGNFSSVSTKDHMNIPVSTIQTLNIGRDGQLICVPSSSSSTTGKLTPSTLMSNKNIEPKITTTTFTKNISTTTLQPITTTSKQQITSIGKLELGQPLQKVRLIPTTPTNTSTPQRILPTATTTTGTQIKLSKNSKLYPITYSNGAAPFTEMYVVNNNKNINIGQKTSTIVKVIKNEERIVDWETELDKKRTQDRGNTTTAKVIVQSIAGDDIISMKNQEMGKIFFIVNHISPQSYEKSFKKNYFLAKFFL